jgi:ElaB/YqjD/DUF883 family membrane-anchored ribosome-binding protein
MKIIQPLSVDEAEREIRESTHQIEDALNQLRGRVDDGMSQVERYLRASKNPYALMGMAVVVGIFFGQLIRVAFEDTKV